jgi:Tfp pilus assembly protein PilF
MPSSLAANLEKLLGTPRDGALLRYSLGLEHLKAGDAGRAIGYLRDALARDAGYSAAWKLLGKSLEQAGMAPQALEAYRSGISAARARGDKQLEKEMTVFARRIEKALAQGSPDA